ncbi:MAG: hypothetical protein GF375_04885 [Candidatus Omnitrophica bacterium]|nr:hypothetical protein [Candidatus Omnitrophota bacterium]
MKAESYANSIREAVKANHIEVSDLDTIVTITMERRQKIGVIRPDDWAMWRNEIKHRIRIRSALMTLRRNGEAVLIGRAKYRFFI